MNRVASHLSNGYITPKLISRSKNEAKGIN